MPGAKPSVKPLSAGRSTESSLDEVSQLEQHLQRQLEEDIARIFDESIYADLEVACGKLNILTHSCILKARTHKFYHKLEAILHVNIGRKTFDEIYSFISDVYTECDIPHQENEIICYLNDKLNLKPVTTVGKKKNKQEDLDESDAYATPNCTSPEENSLQKTLSSSPSTELTKEYYALVPIDGQILDKELIEQDELSSAFKSFIQFRTEQSLDKQTTQCIKPTTLSLNSSHISKINKHSVICDTTKDLKEIDSKSYLFENDKYKINNATSQVRKHISEISKCTQLPLKTSYNGETSGDAQDCGYSPDSLIADEPSSSSDYLSAAHSASPGLSHAAAAVGFRDNFAKMNNTFNTASDSGIENNGMLESLNSHKDVTITDISLTESTLHDFLTDEAGNGDSAPDAIERRQLPKAKPGNSQLSLTSAYRSSIAEMSAKTSKDEKQRQNEEIVILESSSLSSETGSWESVFPPKMPEKDLCEKFINIERHNSVEPAFKNRVIEAATVSMTFQCTDEAQKSSIKSTCCFIDAASLVDEEEKQQGPFTINTNNVYRSASQPVPFECKQDISPIDFSESNDNEDSLEQPDPDSIQKDISPTIFEMTLNLEDSVVEEKTHKDIKVLEPQNPKMYATPVTVACNSVNNITKSCTLQTVLMTSTPNNSIISLKASDIKTYDSEGSDNDATFSKLNSATSEKQTTELPITPRLRVRQDFVNKISNDISYSSGASFEGHLLLDGSKSDSAMPKKKTENIPIGHGSYTHSEESKSEITPKTSSSAAAWVVDMSKVSEPEVITTNWNNKKPGDKTCDTLKASSKSGSNSEGCKSRSSVDSDSSERSTHKFYIDLSTLPDALTPEQNSASEASNEKKNIFSMFIDLGEKSSTVKEMPARLSLNTKKTCKVETKHTTTKIVKANKKSSVMINGKDNFEKHDTCHSSQVSVSEIIQNPNPNIKKNIQEQRGVEIIEIQEYHRPFPREIVAPTINEESDDQFCDIFVRLSDLDRTPAQKNDTVNNTAPKTECVERMTRSIPDNNWGESSHTSSRSIDIISSFHSENALSLNRLFPHLKNDISRSMPGSLSGRTRSPLRFGVSSSPGERDELASDMSEMSSVQSSMCRSVVENSTTEDTSHTSSLLINCQSRLGQDLLRMFMEEIAPDVIVEVSGRRIKAHKCILSSRCQYFAGILSGGWVESAGNVISLPPFSFSVVHFALCHIYSGISTIPDSISIVELATIADMLGLEGLKEAIMFTLKAKYCHHFHEPCQVCTAGVLECFPLSSVYGLDDLYRRCLRWITKHFRKVWPTKAFATLPSELLEKCYQEQLLNLTPDNLIDTVYDCRLTGASLHRSRWAEVVARLCRRLEAACAQFAARRLASVVRAVSAASAARGEAGGALDECLAAAADCAPLDELCRALALLHAHAHADRADRSKPDLIAESAPHAERLGALRRRCEAALVRDSSRAMFAPAFKELPSELRRRLRDQMHRYLDCSLPPRSPQPPPPRRHGQRAPPRDMERVRACFVPYAHSPAPAHASASARPAAAAAADHPPRVRTTKAQEERAKYNMSKSTAKVPERTVRGRAAYEHAKPRYLEPRASKEPPARKPLGKLLSSSESSRNSSPVLPRAPRPAPATAGPSTDSLSDSLNTNKYATYTKNRRLENLSSSIPSKSPKGTGTAGTGQPVKARATKIPVYMKQEGASGMRASVPPARDPRRRGAGGVAAERSSPLAQRHRGSLMMATKSSSAKIVPKTIKESHQAHSKSAKPEGAKQPVKQVRPRSPSIADIPIMERSGTFLKDEPTFGDITTNIDIDE